MEGSPHIFSAPLHNTDDSSFKPLTKLPEHLDQYQKISSDLRNRMTPVMKAVLDLTDKMALRPAALSKPE